MVHGEWKDSAHAIAYTDPVFARFLPSPPVTPRAGTVYLVCTSAGEVGVEAVRVETLEACASAMAAGFQQPGPLLIELVV